jgi:hypothetical protein
VNTDVLLTPNNTDHYFLAFTVSGTSNTNGILYRATNGGALVVSPDLNINNQFTPIHVRIGSDQFSEGADPLAIDNVMVFDAVLTEAEIQNLRQQRLPTRTAGLNVWYPLFKAGDVEIDYSGNGRNATKVGSSFADAGVAGIPWLRTEMDERFIEAAPSGDMAGTAAITFGAAATIAGAGALAGTAAVGIGGAATIAGAGAMTGVAPVSVGAEGEIAGAGALGGTAPIAFGGDATPGATGAIQGTAAVALGGAAQIAGAGAMAGAAAVQVGGAGAAAGTAQATGVAAIALGGEGDISGTATGAGTAAITTGGAATIAGTGALAGAAAAQFGGSAAPEEMGPISGTAAITFGATGALTGAGAMAGVASIAFGGTGTGVAGGSADLVHELAAVIMDASSPSGTVPRAKAAQQSISWPRGQSGRIRLALVRQDRSVPDLTGCTVKLGIKRQGATAVLVDAVAVIDVDAGTADVTIPEEVASALLDRVVYAYDVQLQTADGARWQIVPASRFTVRSAVGRSAD